MEISVTSVGSDGFSLSWSPAPDTTVARAVEPEKYTISVEEVG